VPMLFLQGSRDKLAEFGLLSRLIDRLGERASLQLIQDADHSFRVPARAGRRDADVKRDTMNALAAWIGSGVSPRGLNPRRASDERKRSAARARAFAASTSRSRGGAVVTRASSNSCATCATCSTARLNAAWFALDGRVNPLSLRTNCRADARISSSVAGGSKLCSVLMFRHMRHPRLFNFALPAQNATTAYGDRFRNPLPQPRRAAGYRE